MQASNVWEVIMAVLRTTIIGSQREVAVSLSLLPCSELMSVPPDQQVNESKGQP